MRWLRLQSGFCAVEREAQAIPNAVATVGRLEVSPGASNVIPGSVHASLDVRHADDAVRQNLLRRLLERAEQIAAGRCLTVSYEAALRSTRCCNGL